MTFPQPTPAQARVIWLGLTVLALAMFLAFVASLTFGLAWVAQKLSSILLPLAVAGIFAYLLDPIVDGLERFKVPRVRGILLVFFLGVMIVLIAMSTIIPRLIVEIQAFGSQVPELSDQVQKKVETWLTNSTWGEKARQAWEGDIGANVKEWAGKVAPAISGWALAQLSKVASWFGLLVGFAMVPVFLFYFLLEKRGIESHWTNYLPLHESRAKEEAVFILKSINEYLILFFRGQVLVALADGILLTIGFFSMGLNFALLLGMTAGLLSIVPFLGVAISIIPAVILAAVQFGDWLHPLLVVGLFALVQFLEGFVISPKIMGDRVGLHPLTIIIAVMVGTTLLGGITGGILAIPLTAALRVLMFRYIWRRSGDPTAHRVSATP
ncbi:MAG TPA: AI-2E family transporter [Verrucomicrobiae bacterium]|nr:AI-2E family transporter [Verrucomicrobiae bacterium]